MALWQPSNARDESRRAESVRPGTDGASRHRLDPACWAIQTHICFSRSNVPLMALAIVVVVKWCHPNDSRRLAMLALTLAVLGLAMNVAVGYRVKAWVLTTERRLEAMENVTAIH